jgi:hypothetical protein
MSDPWADEWNSMTYTERLNWWWAARKSYQTQEDYAAGKAATEGVSCKYGIPGYLPGTRTPYVKKLDEPKAAEEPKVEEPKSVEDSKPAEETPKPAEEANTEEPKAEDSSEEEKPVAQTLGTVNLVIPPSTSSLNVSKNKKKKKGKGKH